MIKSINQINERLHVVPWIFVTSFTVRGRIGTKFLVLASVNSRFIFQSKRKYSTSIFYTIAFLEIIVEKQSTFSLVVSCERTA